MYYKVHFEMNNKIESETFNEKNEAIDFARRYSSQFGGRIAVTEIRAIEWKDTSN